jgi:hypothetical protein
MAVPAETRVYQPRETQGTILYQVVSEYLPKFIAQADSGVYNVPAFVQGELEAFLACGDPARGFTHLKCPRCGHNRALPFS